MEDWQRHLSAALPAALPGPRAQRWLAPSPRPGWDPEREAPSGRPAAVLALMYPAASREREWKAAHPGAIHLLYTERTGTVEWHKKQVAFPGGTVEAGETSEQAALREAEEEVGLSRSVPQILGRLTPLWIPATGFTIHPVVAVADRRPDFLVNDREVRRIFEPTLDSLMAPGAVRTARSMMDGLWVRVPYFDLEGARLWGATAMITAELLALLGWPGLAPQE